MQFKSSLSKALFATAIIKGMAAPLPVDEIDTSKETIQLNPPNGRAKDERIPIEHLLYKHLSDRKGCLDWVVISAEHNVGYCKLRVGDTFDASKYDKADDAVDASKDAQADEADVSKRDVAEADASDKYILDNNMPYWASSIL